MKTSTILIVLLLAFATKTSLFALAKNPVLDSNGDKVETGVQYYVSGAVIGIGNLDKTFDPVKICPEVVVEDLSGHKGLPVTFSKVNSIDDTDDIVYENAYVTIMFAGFTICPTSTIWQVVHDKSIEKDSVTLGGIEGESATLFTLKKYESDAYKFNHLGSDIGMYSQGPIRLVVDNENPHGWKFVKANKSKTIKQVVNV